MIKKMLKNILGHSRGISLSSFLQLSQLLAEQGKQDKAEIFLYSIYLETPDCITMH